MTAHRKTEDLLGKCRRHVPGSDSFETIETVSPKPRYTDAGSAGAGYLADALLTGVGFTNGTCGQEQNGDVLF